MNYSQVAQKASQLEFTVVKNRNTIRAEKKEKDPLAPVNPKNNSEERRRLVMIRDGSQPLPKFYDAEVMGNVNIALAANGAPNHIRIERVTRSLRNNITALVAKSATAEMTEQWNHVILRAARKVDEHIIAVEKNETWNKLKINQVSLERFFPEHTNRQDPKVYLERLRQEIEATNPDIKSALPLVWLTGPARLRQKMLDEGIRNSTVVINVRDNSIADRMINTGVMIGGRRHTVTRYIRAGPDTLCNICSRWGHHEHNCGALHMPLCMFCGGQHLSKDHKCNVPMCTIKGALCMFTKKMCCNCGGDHIAKASVCPVKKAAVEEARKNRISRWENQQEEEHPLDTPMPTPTPHQSQEVPLAAPPAGEEEAEDEEMVTPPIRQ
jgi:hypothetical protein